MERTTDWKVPAALILAGLALLVALSGRGFSFPGGPRAQSIVVSADEAFRLEKGIYPKEWGDKFGAIPQPEMPLVKPEMPVAPDVPDIPAPPDNILRDKMLRYSLGGSDNPIDGAWQYAQGLLDYLSPLFQWVALALLLWLGYRYLTQRNRPPAASAVPPSAPAQAPPPAPNHGDIIKPESHKEE